MTSVHSPVTVYLETLRLIASSMGPQRGFQASLQFLLALLAERHGFLRPHLVIFDPETRTLRLCVADGAPRAGQVVYEPGMGVTGQVFVSGKPVIVECLKNHPVFLSKFFARTEEELASLAFLSVPVLAPLAAWEAGEGQVRRVIGVLSVDTPGAPREELEMYRSFLEVVASMIATQAAYLQDDMARQQRISERSEKGIMTGGLEDGVVCESAAMRDVMKQAGYAAHARSPVLISGEQGTGKARLAALIHAAGPRHDMPLVRFYSVADDTEQPSDELLERELFGYRKGAFPGAMQTRKGLFELAHCSTLFLDNVDRLSLPLQAKLLHVLQEKTVTRVGGGQPVPVDVRLVCATRENLPLLVEQGRFLADLFNRISAISIHLPPLRERPEDILPLAEYFLKVQGESCGRNMERIASPAKELLEHYSWPGNIRELAQCIETGIHAADGTVLRAVHLPMELQKNAAEKTLPFNEAVARFEQELLIDALQRAGGNMLQAARDLQVTYRIVNYKIKKYGIDPHRYS